MIEYRKAKPEERGEYIRFADMVFLGDAFEQILPKVYGSNVDSARMHHLAVDSEKGIRGLVAVMPGCLHAGDAVLKTGFIGTVSVHPDARGEGHMKKLMAKTLEDMRSEDTDIAILHGQRQRYEHFGYVQGGSVYEFTVNMANVRHALSQVESKNVRFVAVEPGGTIEKQLSQMHSERRMYFERPEFRTCCMSFLNRLYAAMMNNELIGWIVCSGCDDHADLSEIMADSIAHFDAVLKAWIEQNDLGEVKFPLGDFERELVRHVCGYAGNVQYQHSANLRVLKHAKTIEALMKVKSEYTELADGEVSFEIDGERFSVEVKDGNVSIGEWKSQPLCLNQFDADMLFFYPHDYEGRPHMPAGWFPLPFHTATPDAF